MNQSSTPLEANGYLIAIFEMVIVTGVSSSWLSQADRGTLSPGEED